ncbi:MAG: Rne/Rng family ribonuclease [Pseudomonadales bacterium]|nr:Rne/Rng family ribonuclease [Pseudomonadales bacterium]MCP5185395.1 Rne/Rng family ribonuclease [Pseudomonadales bacterium]
MKSELLINVTPFETRVALVLDGLLTDVQIARASGGSLTGNVYLGRIERIIPGMQAAFVNIGLDRPGFLHVRDVTARADKVSRGAEYVDHETGPASTQKANQEGEVDIRELLHEGQQLLVQISKDPISTKGARLTTDIALASRYAVLMPFDTHVGISQRIDDVEERARLRTAMETVRQEHGIGMGLIARTVAEGASRDVVASDILYLARLWEKLWARRREVGCPALVYEDLPIHIRVMRDMVLPDVELITIDEPDTYERVRRFVDEFLPEYSERVHRHAESRPLFERYGIEDEIRRALEPRVPLRSGGYLVVEQTEAMVTIDVNTGGFLGSRTLEETVFRANLEAAQAIPRHLRLRNLGGIIVIDFIDMVDGEHRRQVLRALEKACEGDAARIRIDGYSAFGLVQMSRKRTRESLLQQVSERCGSCGGTGRTKSAESACIEILRSILYHARQACVTGVVNEYLVRAGQPVIDRLLDEDAPLLSLLASEIQRHVRLQVEPCYSTAQFDLVCVPVEQLPP